MCSLDRNSKIYVAGHRGLVGSAIWNNLKSRGYSNLTGRTHQELDLLDQKVKFLHYRSHNKYFPL